MREVDNNDGCSLAWIKYGELPEVHIAQKAVLKGWVGVSQLLRWDVAKAVAGWPED